MSQLFILANDKVGGQTTRKNVEQNRMNIKRVS